MRTSISSYLSLIVIALWFATPAKLIAQPAACLAAADLANTSDFEASPRPDESAELLALWYADGLVADGALYGRLHADLVAAGRQVPILDLWPVHRGLESPTIIVVRFVDESARDDAEAGNNEAFNCLIEVLDVSHLMFFSSLEYAEIEFDGRYNTTLAGSLFELIPEIDMAGPGNNVAYLDAGCFYTPDGSSRVYFLEEVLVFYPGGSTGNVERIDVASNGTVSYEEYDHRNQAPWRDEYVACLDHQLSGELDPSLATVEDIPTLSQIGLALLVLSLLAAGVVRSRLV